MAHRTTLEEDAPQNRQRRPETHGRRLAKGSATEERERTIRRFPPLGYLEATLDPARPVFEPLKQPDLQG